MELISPGPSNSDSLWVWDWVLDGACLFLQHCGVKGQQVFCVPSFEERKSNSSFLSRLLCWVHKVLTKTAKLGHRNSMFWNCATAAFSKGCFVSSGTWRLGQLYAKLVVSLASSLVTVEAWFQGAVPLETGSMPCARVSSKRDNWWGTCSSHLLFLSCSLTRASTMKRLRCISTIWSRPTSCAVRARLLWSIT